MNNIVNNAFKISVVLIGLVFLYLVFLIYQATRDAADNGRYQKFGESNNLIIDTRTGHVTDADY